MNDHDSDSTTDNSTKSETDQSSPGVEVSNVSGLVDELAGGMSEPSEFAIEAELAKQAQTRAQWADLLDSDGNHFDPAIHVTNSDGEPSLTLTGKLRKRPGKKGAKPSKVGGVANESELAQKAKARLAGITAANTLIALGMAFGGEEWQPKKIDTIGLDEQSNLERAFADYFEATGKTDFPPGVALTIAVGAYALPRFSMPKTKARGKAFFGKVYVWWQTRKGKKKSKPLPKDEKQDTGQTEQK